ncbi:MAG: extracellular solute-binding protein [Planctomycetota bacterium]
MWTGFAARARILIVNDEKLKPADRPKSYRDLIAPKYRGQCVIAKPLAGTTATHMIALFQVLGEEPARTFLTQLASDIGIAPGNAHVMRQVREGVAAWGFTDTDDFWVAKSEGAKVSAVYPDQGEGEIGTLVLPNTVALIKHAPDAENGKRLIDYLLSDEVEQRLAAGRSAQIPLHPGVARPDHVKAPGKDFRAMKVDFQALVSERAQRLDQLKAWFLK